MDPVASLLSTLIEIPSVNPMGREYSGPEFLETNITGFLEDWTRAAGLETRRETVAPGRDNLYATYHSSGSSRHVMLEVHQDTVPVDGMAIDPFKAVVDGDRMYGRGACDNKGPMTAMLLAMKRLADERPTGVPTVTLALSVDEEHTFTGVQKMVQQGITVDEAIVAEPTELDVVVAHKGVVRWHLLTRGRACHSSDPSLGFSAIYRMADVLKAIEEYAGVLSNAPSHELLGKPTISVGRIEGGIAVNIVPDLCSIEVDRRVLPGESVEDVPAGLDEFLRDRLGGEAWFESKPPWLLAPSMGTEINGSLTERFGNVLRRFRTDFQTGGVPFGTDASTLHQAGIPAIVFGPGSIQQAHTKDEWVSLDQVRTAAEIYFAYCTDTP